MRHTFSLPNSSCVISESDVLVKVKFLRVAESNPDTGIILVPLRGVTCHMVKLDKEHRILSTQIK